MHIPNETHPTSHIRLDEYVPLTVAFAEDDWPSHHVEFIHGETGCLELALDWDTGALKKLVLVLCQSYVECDEVLAAPAIPSEVLRFDPVSEIRCPCFSLTTYRDGASLQLGDTSPREWFRMGQVLFGFGSNGNVQEVLVSGMSGLEIAHLKAEVDIIVSGA